MSNLDRNWDERYLRGDTPWDSGRPEAELIRILKDGSLPRGRALELGCGTGTNAIYLAQSGFDVTAVDCAAPALDKAREKAAAAGVSVAWIQADVLHFTPPSGPYDFLFDRGCYHCCREVDLAGYLETHRRATRPGSWCLVLAGNPNDGEAGGPPRVAASQLVAEFEPLYRLLVLREFHFEDAGGARGPLGWSCLMQRR
jgi:SAM-dependent methyltransferase